MAGGVSLVFLAFSVRAYRRKHLMDNLPTSKTAGVFIGLVEVEGTAESEEFLTSYLAGRSCVYYEWSVEEEWERTSTDSKGNKSTTSGWETVASGGDRIPFYVKDDTGVVLILPERAEIKATSYFSETCSRQDRLYYAKGPRKKVSNSTGRRRFQEKGIDAHAPLYVIGTARERRDIVAPEIAYQRGGRLFLISAQTQSSLSRGYGCIYSVCLYLPIVTSLLIFHFAYKDKQWANEAFFSSMVVWGVGYFSLFVIVALWIGYNHLVDLRNRVRTAGSMIEVELKRRSELIPQLVQVVESYRQHEAWVQEAVADMRKQANIAQVDNRGGYAHAVAPLLKALRESYPDLKSDSLFRGLHSELVTTEQRIALARSYYNEITTNYNTRISVFPNSLIALLGKFRHRSLIRTSDFERASVGINLAD